MENQTDTDTLNGQQIEPNLVDQQTLVNNKPKTNYRTIGVIILISFVTFGFGGYYLGRQTVQFQQDTRNGVIQLALNEPSVANSPSEIPTPTQDPTSQWITYTDTIYQFNFKYPQDWQNNCTTPSSGTWLSTTICDLRAPGTNVDHGQLVNGADVVIGVNKPNANYSNLAEYVQFSVKQDKYNSIAKTINNINGYQLTSQANSAFVFEKNGHFIVISWIPLAQNNPYFSAVNQILSTFELSAANTQSNQSNPLDVAKEYLNAYVGKDWVTAKKFSGDNGFDENIAAGYGFTTYEITGSKPDSKPNYYHVYVKFTDQSGTIFDKAPHSTEPLEVLMFKDNAGKWTALTWYFYQ